MANLPAIHRYIESHKQEHIAKVQEFLRYADRMQGAGVLFDCGANQDSEGNVDMVLGNNGLG